MERYREREVHVRHDGHSTGFPLRMLELSRSALASDAAVLEAVTTYMQLPRLALREYMVDRPRTGNLIVRPRAVYG